MAEDLKIQEGLEGVGGQEGKEAESAPSTAVPGDKAPVESAPAPEKPSTEVVSNPSSSSIPLEAVAPKIALNPTDGGSWDTLSKEVGETTS